MKQFRSLFIKALACFSLMLASGCSQTDPYQQRLNQWLRPHSDTLPVLCTTEMIEALVSEIGGQHVRTLSLIYGELDPHSYQMVKGDSQKFSKARIIFCNGLDLEHGPSLKTALAEHPRAIFLAEPLLKQNREAFIFHAATPDPHIWLDLELFSKLCPLIAQELSLEDPAHKSYYETRALALEKQMLEQHLRLKDRFQAVPKEKRYLVTSHEAFYYLARGYLKESGEDESAWKARFCAPEGLAPESQISLHRIMEIVNYIQKHQVKSAFYEVNVTMDAIHKIQEVLSKHGYDLKIPTEPLFSDCMPPMNEVQGQDPTRRYFYMINSNSDIILEQWK
jgi:manganese/zinc/iron transport system substrate-binding protein